MTLLISSEVTWLLGNDGGGGRLKFVGGPEPRAFIRAVLFPLFERPPRPGQFETGYCVTLKICLEITNVLLWLFLFEWSTLITDGDTGMDGSSEVNVLRLLIFCPLKFILGLVGRISWIPPAALLGIGTVAKRSPGGRVNPAGNLIRGIVATEENT